MVSSLQYWLLSSALFVSFYMMMLVSAPLLLGVLFIITICLSVYNFCWALGDLLSYMLFLVYVGGLLVLMIYMIMISSNVDSLRISSVVVLMSFSLALISSFMISVTDVSIFMEKSLSSAGEMMFNTSSLGLLGALLLYIFMGVCSAVVIGGRSLNFGS